MYYYYIKVSLSCAKLEGKPVFFYHTLYSYIIIDPKASSQLFSATFANSGFGQGKLYEEVPK